MLMLTNVAVNLIRDTIDRKTEETRIIQKINLYAIWFVITRYRVMIMNSSILNSIYVKGDANNKEIAIKKYSFQVADDLTNNIAMEDRNKKCTSKV